ncbi:hypothetical protein LguiB_003630 [Lonicera macranthoides]
MEVVYWFCLVRLRRQIMTVFDFSSSSSSSDNENDLNLFSHPKIKRLFGPQKPVHVVLGGGKYKLRANSFCLNKEKINPYKIFNALQQLVKKKQQCNFSAFHHRLQTLGP